MELAIAIAEGRPWLGFPCRKGRVLYVNLEIDSASCISRFYKIYESLGIPRAHTHDIQIWNLRGMALPLDKLVPLLVRRMRNHKFDAVIIDPIYKVITGDENSASDMAFFCNQFDKICNETGSSAIYCHHHSKGAQGDKIAKDRASGSGVFARDPDAQLDMIELALTGDMKDEAMSAGVTAWRLESSLREFPNITPVEFWFDYPIHRLEMSSRLNKTPATGSTRAGRMNSSKYTTPEERQESIRNAYSVCAIEEPVTIKAMSTYMGITERCVRDRLREMPEEFTYKDGIVTLIDS